MGFNKEDKPKAMTTADQINRPVTVVSSQSGNAMDVGSEQITDVGEQFTEVGHPINVDVPDSAQAVKGNDPAEYTGFATGVHINTMRTSDLENFMRESVIARPVRLPNNLTVRSKDPQYRLRWVEFKSEDGRRYNDCCNMGFRNAKPEEVVGLNTTLKVQPDGIKYNDVILMIIPCETLDGYYKYNALRALKMVSQKGSAKIAAAEGNAQLRQGMADAGINPNSRAFKDAAGHPKIEIYDPNA